MLGHRAALGLAVLLAALLFTGLMLSTESSPRAASPPWPGRLGWLHSADRQEIDRGASGVHERDDAIVGDLVGVVELSLTGAPTGPYALRGAILSLGNLGPRALPALPVLLRTRASLRPEPEPAGDDLLGELAKYPEGLDYVKPEQYPDFEVRTYPDDLAPERLADLVRQEISLRIAFWPRKATLTTVSETGAWGNGNPTVGAAVIGGGGGHSVPAPAAAGPPPPRRVHPTRWLVQWALKRVVDPGDASWWAADG